MAAARSFGRILDPMLTIRQMSRDLAPRKRVLLVKQYDITVRGLKAGKVSSSAAKRFGVQKSGRITRAHAFKVHKNTHKSRGHVNRLGANGEVTKADATTALRLLGLK
ncbi:hypothetical protein FNF27_07857 [Cafeteria roenbergensis]|uniref:50S ribosomal protein L35 n=1 Tax=Cafeteria roenbergensis TaxID=33653 RepID=A0A5A8CGD3_CAFRO|nr:hypothetical protein FNF29_06543 [Cafeteria roenbergensis]KAA0151190.1 hypothetical protein FNF31_06879 [Cafeteria roenbergensis]KAA0153744.1 hypothetical protein FNF28_06916 [Cafeteria roenbergensis]KAA0163964.1 hypothetical protein FNF27_07857 [Cafeteria roenbergensis]|mmetsp:Transcript_24018/g.90701  ORF Transcript_24018/g.90701 Transcript_24018/m.90701 type:complete len:108 (-) Transcript_24018:234-557(-)|eukprot:KAA0148605.1 hypothetical protein FNF29_06543 [Cafeteria roenbergensis]